MKHQSIEVLSKDGSLGGGYSMSIRFMTAIEQALVDMNFNSGQIQEFWSRFALNMRALLEIDPNAIPRMN